MNKQVKIEKLSGLEKLRAPFEDRHIGKLPKPLKWQTDKYKEDKSTGGKCDLCGTYHHKDVIHLDYVGHAALTDRLLDCDPKWNWEPYATDEHGLPAFDKTGGLWIKLTVCGVTRSGYGHAAGASFKDIGSREKEVIGDALRNAAMRFGAALDLWHKGDLHETEHEEIEEIYPAKPKGSTALDKNIRPFISAILSATSIEEFEQIKIDYAEPLSAINEKWPAYMKEVSGEQTKSFNQQIADHKKRLQSQADIEKQQIEDLNRGHL